MITKQEAIEKASRCLHCSTPQCSINGCPIHTKIPDFIQAIKDDDLKLAYKILQKNNVMSHICGKVCPQEKQCEGSCVLGNIGEPVEIGTLETFVNDWAKEHDWVYDYNKDKVVLKNEFYDFKKILNHSNDLKKKVAIVGTGPSGLECCYQLIQKGYDVELFDKEWAPGGVMYYGIPDFRLSKMNVLFDVVRKITYGNTVFDSGINSSNCVGSTYGSKLEDLQKDYDAVFLAMGLTKSSDYKLSDEECRTIYRAEDFLKLYAKYVSHDVDEYTCMFTGDAPLDYNMTTKNAIELNETLGKVIVIGGGNVAIDCSRVALNMGASESKILYRRDEEHMPASKKELTEAKRDGVIWCEKVRVISANIKDGKLNSINCIKTQIIDNKAVDIEGSEFEEECNTVVFAIGMKSDKEALEKLGLELNDWGNIKIDDNFKTNLDKVFAAGDIVGETATIANAIKSGRNAANAIDVFLSK